MDVSEYAETLIQIKAKSLVDTYGFTESDIDDIEQELRLDLLQRLPSYDPKRAQLSTFTDRVVKHGVATLIEHHEAAKRNWRRCCLSLNQPTGDDNGNEVEIADMVETDYRRRDARNIDLAIAMADVLKTLPPKLLEICRRLPDDTVKQVAADLGVSRMTIYRHIAVIRARFEEAGLDQYL